MPNDAKLGLVVGVGLVILLGVVYCRKDDTVPGPAPESYARPAPAATPPPLPLSHNRPLVLKSTAHPGEEAPGLPTSSSARPAVIEADSEAPTEAIPEAETDAPEYRSPGRSRP